MATTFSDTYQTIALDSPEGRKLLRRIASRPDEGWTFFAAAADGWRIGFRRRVVGRTGEATAWVEIETDGVVSTVGATGTVCPDGDGPGIAVPSAAVVHSHGAEIAGLILAGRRLQIRHHVGSIKTRAVELSFVELEAVAPGRYTGVTVEQCIVQRGKILVGTAFIF